MSNTFHDNIILSSLLFMIEQSFKGVSNVLSAPSVITQISTHKTGSLQDHLFFINILINKEKEKLHTNDLQFV